MTTTDEILVQIGKRLESIEQKLTHDVATKEDVKRLDTKIDTIDLKVEAVHSYQKQAHDWIVEQFTEMNEINWHAIIKRIKRIEEHLNLPHSA